MVDFTLVQGQLDMHSEDDTHDEPDMTNGLLIDKWGKQNMGDMADHISNYDYGNYDYDHEPEGYEPGIEPGSGTYTVKSKSKSDPEFYYQEFREVFKTIEIEHETEKAFLFYTEKGSFWCPKKLVKIKDIKNIFTWKIWKSMKYDFKPNDLTIKKD